MKEFLLLVSLIFSDNLKLDPSFTYACFLIFLYLSFRRKWTSSVSISIIIIFVGIMVIHIFCFYVFYIFKYLIVFFFLINLLSYFSIYIILFHHIRVSDKYSIWFETYCFSNRYIHTYFFLAIKWNIKYIDMYINRYYSIISSNNPCKNGFFFPYIWLIIIHDNTYNP